MARRLCEPSGSARRHITADLRHRQSALTAVFCRFGILRSAAWAVHLDPLQNSASRPSVSGAHCGTRPPTTFLTFNPFALKTFFERAEQQHPIVLRTPRAHQTDAPVFPFEHPQPPADLDIEFIEQSSAHASVIHSL